MTSNHSFSLSINEQRYQEMAQAQGLLAEFKDSVMVMKEMIEMVACGQYRAALCLDNLNDTAELTF